MSVLAPIALPQRPTTLLFDLDGTLTDPFDGITRSMRHAMARLGRPVPEEADLRWCIGPPLAENFRTLLGPDEALILQGIAFYRERYGEIGAFENAVYDGIPALLEALRERGYALHVCTSKLEPHAQAIVEHFGLAPHFGVVHGSKPDLSHANKAELIAFILEQHGLSAGEVVMIGDRRHDVDGARANGVAAVSVGWGYGSAEEIAAAAPARVVQRPEELLALFG